MVVLSKMLEQSCSTAPVHASFSRRPEVTPGTPVVEPAPPQGPTDTRRHAAVQDAQAALRDGRPARVIDLEMTVYHEGHAVGQLAWLLRAASDKDEPISVTALQDLGDTGYSLLCLQGEKTITIAGATEGYDGTEVRSPLH